MTLSLAELRAQNEAEDAAEAKLAEVEPEAEAEELEQDEPEEDTEEAEADAEETDSESGKDEPEWAKSEGGAVPVAKHVEMKHKLRAKLDEANTESERHRIENEQLKQRLAALESGRSDAPQALKMPRMDDEDIAYDDEKFNSRMAEYTDALIEQKLSGRAKKTQEQTQQQQFAAQIQADVDKHYERASELVGSGAVTAENYQAADMLVRRAVASTVKGDGEYITDYMIANLGAGSEKVIYHLGVNPQALSTLKEHLQRDPSGLRAASYLGGLSAKFSVGTVNKLSNAPKPDKALNGTATVSSGSHSKAYQKAVKADDPGAMVRAKRAAKAAGIDTSKW